MKKILIILLVAFYPVLSWSQTIADTTKFIAFDPSKSWITTGALLRTYVIDAGSTAITTLGTVTSGTWNASTIPIANGGTGESTANSALNALLPSQTTNGTKFLQTDGTNTSWATASGSVSDGNKGDITVSGLGATWTINNNTITGAKIAMGSDVAGDLIYYNGTDYVRFGIGTASQLLRVNSGATAPEWATIAVGGDLVNGGQSTAATVSFGTTDANAAAITTNSITRFSITGGASTGGAFTFANVNALTNTVQDVATFTAATTGVAAANYGQGLLFKGHTSTGVMSDMARTRTYWTTATNGTQEAGYSIMLGDAGGALVDKFKFDAVSSGSGVFTIGSASALTISNSALTPSTPFTISTSSTLSISSSSSNSGALQITYSGTSSTGFRLYLGDNSATSQSSINIGAAVSHAQTSGTKNYINYDTGFSPTSGTAVHNQFSFTGTFNQTGGANGIIRGINFAHTMTAVADYRAIEIADNLANTKGIYQTGALTTNNFVGKTAFGSTTAPADAVTVTGNLNLLVSGNKLKIATGSNASIGTSTLVAGTVTVSTTAVATGSHIVVCYDTPGGTLASGLSAPVASIVNGTSFVINSLTTAGVVNTLDTSSVRWWIVN